VGYKIKHSPSPIAEMHLFSLHVCMTSTNKTLSFSFIQNSPSSIRRKRDSDCQKTLIRPVVTESGSMDDDEEGRTSSAYF
jgi:hypothetical protein